jgi:hypothetical protein
MLIHIRPVCKRAVEQEPIAKGQLEAPGKLLRRFMYAALVFQKFLPELRERKPPNLQVRAAGVPSVLFHCYLSLPFYLKLAQNKSIF